MVDGAAEWDGPRRASGSHLRRGRRHTPPRFVASTPSSSVHHHLLGTPTADSRPKRLDDSTLPLRGPAAPAPGVRQGGGTIMAAMFAAVSSIEVASRTNSGRGRGV